MRIAVVIATSCAGRGGFENIVADVAAGLEGRGHSLLVLLLDHPTDRHWERQLPNVKVAEIAASPRMTWRHFGQAAYWVHRQLASFRPSVVVATDPRGVALAKFATWAWGVPSVSWLHGPVPSGRIARLMRLCAGHFAVSHHLADSIPWRPAIGIGNPIDLDVAVIPRPSNDAPARFVYVGRLARVKRVDRILRSLSSVVGEWRMQVVGDGDELPMLRALASDLMIAERIEWTRWTPQPWDNVASATAMVFTSHGLEGLPTVLLEAAARGVPLIAMDCEFGPRDIVSQNNGWLIPESDDLSTLVDLLQQLCLGTQTVPSLESVRQSVKGFSREAVLDKFEGALSSIAKQPLRAKDATP